MVRPKCRILTIWTYDGDRDRPVVIKLSFLLNGVVLIQDDPDIDEPTVTKVKASRDGLPVKSEGL